MTNGKEAGESPTKGGPLLDVAFSARNRPVPSLPEQLRGGFAAPMSGDGLLQVIQDRPMSQPIAEATGERWLSVLHPDDRERGR